MPFDGNPHFNNHTPPPPPHVVTIPGSIADYVAKLNEDMHRRLMSVTLPNVKRGDEVKVTLGGYVQRVNDDGTYVIAQTREPYDEPVTLNAVPRNAVTLIERDRTMPVRVGDVLTGREVRETRWKRGTVLSYGADLLILDHIGVWHNEGVSDAVGDVFGFADIPHDATFVVEYAPGK